MVSVFGFRFVDRAAVARKLFLQLPALFVELPQPHVVGVDHADQLIVGHSRQGAGEPEVEFTVLSVEQAELLAGEFQLFGGRLPRVGQLLNRLARLAQVGDRAVEGGGAGGQQRFAAAAEPCSGQNFIGLGDDFIAVEGLCGRRCRPRRRRTLQP